MKRITMKAISALDLVLEAQWRKIFADTVIGIHMYAVYLFMNA